MKPRTPKPKKTLRWLLAVLCAGFMLPALMQTVQAATIPVGPGGVTPQQAALQTQQQTQEDAEVADRPFALEPLRQFLISLNNRDEACKGFFPAAKNTHCRPNGDKSDLHLPLYIRDEGYQPQRGSKLGRYRGNPYLSVASKSNGAFRPTNLPAGVNPEKINFVLTEVENRDKPDADLFGDREGNLFIFRNEYNKNLAIGVLNSGDTDTIGAVAGGAVAGIPGAIIGGQASDDKHFAYAPSCRASFQGDSWISDTAVTDSDKLSGKTSSAEDKDELEAFIAERGYKHIEICDTNTSTFAEAIRNAIGEVAEMFTDLIDTASGWLADLVDVGTIANVPGLTNAWLTIRDFVNIIFIVILSAIAMATILRIDTEKYSVRALLPRLVFAVIAVNFSLLMVQILTNLAFIISQPFLAVSRELITNPPADGSIIDPEAGIGPAAVAVVVLALVFVSMVILALFFVVRILVIWLLAALSPFVFLFMILPITRSLSSMWWKNAVKWIFMAPISFIILFVGAEIISGGAGDDVSDPNDPGFFLKVGFFAGALIAAVIIPLKLGGEVMGRAVGGAKLGGKAGLGIGKRLPGARTAGAYMAQRKANKEQAAQLRAAGMQGKVSSGLSRVPGGRAAGSFLTGGNAGLIGAQTAGIDKKFAGDIDSLGLDTGAQRMVARGDVKGLRKAGLHEAAALAKNPAGRRAAGRILAQNQSLNRNTILGGPGAPLELAPGKSDQVAAGNHTLMKGANPVLGNMNRRGEWNEDSLDAIQAQSESSQAANTKEVHWSDINASLKSDNAAERAAATHYVKHLQFGALKKNFDHEDRNFIDSDEERAALHESLQLAGHDEADHKDFSLT